MPATGAAPARESTGPVSDDSVHQEPSGARVWRLPIGVLAIVLCIGTVAMVQVSRFHQAENANGNARQNNSAAFRDGWRLGTTAAEHGGAPNMALGRWRSQEDRALFIAGYQKGYSESLASRPTPAQQAAKGR